jgi:hypothetical protein
MSAVESELSPRSRHAVVLSRVSYKSGWYLEHSLDSAGREYLRWSWRAIDAVSLVDEGGMVKGRRWWLSPQMTESEVVQTALMAALSAEEHETREFFRYEGKRVFNPHINVRNLLKICDDEDARNGY